MDHDQEIERLQNELGDRTRQRNALLAALQMAQRTQELLMDRLTLRPEERWVLAGGNHEDGCIRVREIRSIIQRCFGAKV